MSQQPPVHSAASLFGTGAHIDFPVGNSENAGNAGSTGGPPSKPGPPPTNNDAASRPAIPTPSVTGGNPYRRTPGAKVDQSKLANAASLFGGPTAAASPFDSLGGASQAPAAAKVSGADPFAQIGTAIAPATAASTPYASNGNAPYAPNNIAGYGAGGHRQPPVDYNANANNGAYGYGSGYGYDDPYGSGGQGQYDQGQYQQQGQYGSSQQQQYDQQYQQQQPYGGYETQLQPQAGSYDYNQGTSAYGYQYDNYGGYGQNDAYNQSQAVSLGQASRYGQYGQNQGGYDSQAYGYAPQQQQQYETSPAAIVPSLVDESTTAVPAGGAVAPSVNPFQADDGAGNAYSSFTNEDVSVSTDNLADGGYVNTTEMTPAVASTSGVVPDISLHPPAFVAGVQKSAADFEDVDTVRTRAASAVAGPPSDPFKGFETSQVLNDLDDLILGGSTSANTSAPSAPVEAQQVPAQEYSGLQYGAEVLQAEPRYRSHGGDAVVPQQQTYQDSSSYAQSAGPPIGYGYGTPKSNYSQTPETKPAAQPPQYGVPTTANTYGGYPKTPEVKHAAPPLQANTYGAPPPQQFKLQDWQDSRKASIASATSAGALVAASPTVEFIFCGKCGKKNDPEFNFCGKCGFRLLHGSSPAQAAETPSQTQAVLPEQPPMQQQPSQATIYSSYAHGGQQSNQWGSQTATGYGSPMAAQQDWSGYEQQSSFEQQNSVNSYGQQVYDSSAAAYGTVDPNAYGHHGYSAPNSYFQHQPYGAPQQAPAAQSSPTYAGIHDPLGRMRGHAIATFSFGKLVVTKPSRQNRFVTGANGAQTVVEKAYPDKVAIFPVHTLLEKSFTDTVSSHPGPIISAKSKPKKKELAKIADEFVQRAEATSKDARQAYDVAASGTGFHTGGASSWADVVRAQEQVLLMRVIRLAIESDGVLLGSGPKGDTSAAALRDLLLADRGPKFYSAIGQIESLLLQGDRAGACRAAIGADLWAHALVIASHVDKETYTDVVMNFSRREFDPAIAPAANQVKEFRPSLKLLYGLFGGMGRVAVAEYLPDDVDTVDESSPLQRWKEVLAIILSNRTPGDMAAISALGDRLRACNRLAAAHICYLLSTSNSLLSGVDSIGVRLILLTADHVAAPYIFFKDIKSVQLTELYEASQTLVSGIGLANGLPHFQAYKLLYAMLLADIGYHEQAAKYCESIEVFVKTYSKGSPYFHRKFLEGLRDLSDRLSVATKSGSTEAKDGTSWFKTVSRFDTLMGAIDKGFNKIMNDAIGDPSGNPPADVGRKSPAKALTMVQDTFAALTGAASGSSLSLLRPQSTPASLTSPLDGSTSGPISGGTHSSQMFNYGGSYASTEPAVSQSQSADVLAQDSSPSYGDYGGYSGYYANGDTTAAGDYGAGYGQNQAGAYGANGYASNQKGYAGVQNQYDQHGNAGYGADSSYSQGAGAELYGSYQGYSNEYGESYDPNATAGGQAAYDPNAGASYGQQPYDQITQYGQTAADGNSYGTPYDQYGYAVHNSGRYATQESGNTQPQDNPADHGPTYQSAKAELTQDPYSYGQTAAAPDNAPKAAEQPTSTQSVPPQSTSDTKHTDFDDDLGLGNSALRKKEDKTGGQWDSKEAAKPEKPAATGSYTSMFSSITKVIPFMGRRKSDPDMGGKEKEKATQVHLGGENPFVYNPTTKRWERKDGAPIREEEKKPPPPPMTPVQLSRGSTPAIPGTPSPAMSTSSVTDGLPGRQPSPGPYGTPGTKRGSVASRRTARSRYVDVMNPESANRTPESSVKSFLPTPTLDGVEAKVFKPLSPGVNTYSGMNESGGEVQPSGEASGAASGSAEPLPKLPAPGTPALIAGAAPLRSSTSSAPPASFRPNMSPSAPNSEPPSAAQHAPGSSQMGRSRIPPGLPSGPNARLPQGPYGSPHRGPNPNVPSPMPPTAARHSSAIPSAHPFIPNIAAGQANRQSISVTRPSVAATPGGQGPPPSDL